MPVLTPDLIHATLQEILDCACAALDAESECRCPCRACVVAGPPVWDDCCEGQLTVHLERLYMHDNFPAALRDPVFCNSELAGDVVVTLLRCAPTVKDDGMAPSCPELSESARKIYQEMYILYTAIVCCLAKARRQRKFVIGDAKIVGPEGGCVGVEIRLTIELHDPMPEITP